MSINLRKANLATDEDNEWELDYWARLFKATTWEETKMIATNNEYYLQEASNTLYDLNADFDVRERCHNRAEYYAALKRADDRLEAKDLELAQSKNELAQLHLEVEKLQAEITKPKTAQTENNLIE